MVDKSARASLSDQRVIRVFISSTFSDMQGERDELVKYIFPQLRSLCESRGVVWGEVDLRWGITEEEKAEGKVLPLCLEEIKNCRPYFIGLLGERYGWVPDRIPQGLIESEPWLKENLSHSITELEILHGVLRNPKMAEHAFFYFRDPSYIDTISENQKPLYYEIPSSEEIRRLGYDEAIRRVEERKKKLIALKGRIRTGGFPVRESYPDPKTLGEMVLKDMTAVINRLFPEKSDLKPLQREALEHEQFARQKAAGYVGRRDYIEKIDEFVRGEGNGLLIVGESGSGKSALLSAWYLREAQRQKGALIIPHFLGATPQSTDWAAIVRRTMEEMKSFFGIKEKVPDDTNELRPAFATWIDIASKKGRIILLFDGLNQLDDRDGAPELTWLPPTIPSNVKIVASTLPGRSLDAMVERKWQKLELAALLLEERQLLIREYLAGYSKKLAEPYEQQIIESPQTGNPLFLKVLLEELRLYGDHFTLGEKITYYLGAPNVADLYQLILQRCEEDYEREKPGMVREVLSLLWASRRGLSEGEILDLLGQNNLPLPRAHWTPFYLAMKENFVSCLGLLAFSHEYFRRAVEVRYVPTGDTQTTAHVKLANYFDQKKLLVRKVEEMPWQLAEANEWPRLKATLTDITFFNEIWKNSKFDLHTYWTRLESAGIDQAAKAYSGVLKRTEGDELSSTELESLHTLAAFLEERRSYEMALRFNYRLALHYRDQMDPENAIGILSKVSSLFARINDHESSLLFAESALQIAIKPMTNLHNTLGTVLQYEVEKKKGITRLLAKIVVPAIMPVFRLVTKTNMLILPQLLGGAIEIYARSLASKGVYDRALRLLEIVHLVYRRQFSKNIRFLVGMFSAIGGLVRGFYHLTRKTADAESTRVMLHLWKMDRFREILLPIAQNLQERAAILRWKGERKKAMGLLREEEALCRSIQERRQLALCIGSQGDLYKDDGELQAALGLYKDQERMLRELNDTINLKESLGKQAALHVEIGGCDQAGKLLIEKAKICKALGESDSLRETLINLKRIESKLRERSDDGEIEEAIQDDFRPRESKTVNEVSPIRLPCPFGPQWIQIASLSIQAETQKENGDQKGALQTLKEQQELLENFHAQGIDLYYGALDKKWRSLTRRFSFGFSLLGGIMPLAFVIAVGAAARMSGAPERLSMVLAVSLVLLAFVWMGVRATQKNYRLFSTNIIMTVIFAGIALIAMLLIGKVKLALGIIPLGVLFLVVSTLVMAVTKKVSMRWVRCVEGIRDLIGDDSVEDSLKEIALKDGLQKCLGKQASIYGSLQMYDEGLDVLRQQEALYRDIGNRDALQRCLGEQAITFADKKEESSALERLVEQEQICRELEEKDDLQVCLHFQALLLVEMSRFDEAIRLLEERIDICKEIGFGKGIGDSYHEMAKISTTQGKTEDALLFYKKQEGICQEFDDKKDLQECLGKQVSIYYSLKMYDEELDVLKRQDVLYRQIGNKHALQECLEEQGIAFIGKGQRSKALDSYIEQEKICRELGEKDSLQCCLGLQALALSRMGRFDEAIRLFEESRDICNEIGFKESVSTTYYHMAWIRAKEGRLDDALECLKCASDLGFKDIQSVTGDTIFAPLFERPEFHEVVERVQANAGEQNAKDRTDG